MRKMLFECMQKDWTLVRVNTDSQQKVVLSIPIPSTGKYSMEFYSSAGP